MPSSGHDVIIIGAGPAGLSCALRLQQSKLSVLILEADDRIGGRLKTDEVDGFLCAQLTDWYGSSVAEWKHLRSYRILHALPQQSPPMPDPAGTTAAVKPGVYVCGEYRSVPAIQWALLSGRRAAEAVIWDLNLQ